VSPGRGSSAAVDAFTHRFEPATDPTSRVALLLLHGTGGNEEDLLPLGAMLAPGAARLSPRGQVLENGMPRFFRRIAEGVFDLEDLDRRTRDLADWVEAAVAAYALADRALVAVGFSNGANIGAAMLLLRPESLAGAILLRATLPLEPPALPSLAGRPVLIASGRRDPFVAPGDSERLAAMLAKAGADVTHRWSEGGHELGAGELHAALEWLVGRPWAPLVR
jgi:predicted esterase